MKDPKFLEFDIGGQIDIDFKMNRAQTLATTWRQDIQAFIGDKS